MVEQSAISWFVVGSIPNLADLVVLVALRSLEVQKAIVVTVSVATARADMG